MNEKNRTHRNLTASALCLALTLLLPFVTGQIPQIGSMLLPMHIPVLLCGFLCGPLWGLAVGLIAPALRFALFSMPPLMPVGFAMTFELAAYGLTAGLLYRRLPKTKGGLYGALIAAMIVGRLVWGLAMYVIMRFLGNPFTLSMFFGGAFSHAVPGIILQLLLIPLLVEALHKGGAR